MKIYLIKKGIEVIAYYENFEKACNWILTLLNKDDKSEFEKYLEKHGEKFYNKTPWKMQVKKLKQGNTYSWVRTYTTNSNKYESSHSESFDYHITEIIRG